ncbi:cytochrome b/b6 domain-containing protein [Microbacterium sp. C7(2022)]|uniref:cytochrome b/b6 domain-containing protein n=1 Tax=Microbacterium sp. C7(2022) TaxID=2992759 RepID=UPI00237AEC50|nr:cytochrome b/b6 domain-containing protein [Microbacterium sp. C7(2022)]MDE0546593.1 cytochrome b/b6 domain-containing protein [Microbacterium sp. C7(2022)]
MATYGQTLRRGLPRVAGGEAWPAAGDAPVAGVGSAGAGATAAVLGVAEATGAQTSTPAALVEAPESSLPVAATESVAGAGTDSAGAVAAGAGAASAARTLRRGLPRVAGGEPWPPADATAAAGAGAAVASAAGSATLENAQIAGSASSAAPSVDSTVAEAPIAASSVLAGASADAADEAGATLRRGLPREVGGQPWPPADAHVPAPRPASSDVADAVPVAAAAAAASTPSAPAVPGTALATGPREALPFTRTVWEGRYARTRPEPKSEPARIGPFTRGQWAGAVVVGGLGLLFAAAMAVFAVRWLITIEPFASFIATYPGEYHLPEGAPVGLPAWLGWQHFFNVFLMVLIIRSGWQVRTEKRPSAFWSPKTNNRRKISLNLWFHQSLDILWVVNGAIFVVLLFVTGQWMRIVPTSWEVFPNAISAALQYVSLDWPTENGWVNYNSLQQLAYFTTVFIAAPLAVITGVRMSGIWPKDAKALNKAYPVEWARAVHFPVMLYFVFFIFVHVVLVFATGALRNLNHMYAAQGSVDPDAYAMNWTGFWIFSLSLVVIAGAVAAARPLVLAPIARLFGTVVAR